jgi:hypothetical protein
MRNIFKRKQCKQCGETLRPFDKTDFCNSYCYSLYKQIEKECKEWRDRLDGN